jgi:hypothetical protein
MEIHQDTTPKNSTMANTRAFGVDDLGSFMSIRDKFSVPGIALYDDIREDLPPSVRSKARINK